MILYLIRHGLAEAGGRVPDAERRLTEEGIRRMERQAAVFHRAGVRIDQLCSSPLMRAEETADIIAAEFGIGADTDHLLAPGARLDDLAELADRYPGVEHLMVVGHQPDLGLVLRTLTGSNARVRPATLAVMEVQKMRPGGAVLAGLYDPDVMVRLALPDLSRH